MWTVLCFSILCWSRGVRLCASFVRKLVVKAIFIGFLFLRFTG